MSKAELAILFPCGTAVRLQASSWFGEGKVRTDSWGHGCPLHGHLCMGANK